MKRVVFLSSLIIGFLNAELPAQTPRQNGTPVPVSERMGNNVNSIDDIPFEVVVSSYENNGIKTVIVTRNRKGAFYDRTEWVGKGEIPEELMVLMGKKATSPTLKDKPKPLQSEKLSTKKSFFGVVIQETYRIDGGVEVIEVVNKSPAQKIGLRRGDIIVSMAGNKIEDVDDFSEVMYKADSKKEIVCRFFRGDRLLLERVKVSDIPVNAGLNLKAIDGGEIFSFEQQALIQQLEASDSASKKTDISGVALQTAKNTAGVSNFEGFITPNGNWINLTFNAPSIPLSIITFDKDGKEIFHQHLSWFKGNYKQLIKIAPGSAAPFNVIIAQGANVYSQSIKEKK